jgi:hypothetical protein
MLKFHHLVTITGNFKRGVKIFEYNFVASCLRKCLNRIYVNPVVLCSYFGAVSDGYSSEQNDTGTDFTPSTPFFPCSCHSTVVPDTFISLSHTDVIQFQHLSVSVMNTQTETTMCNYTARWNMYVTARTYSGILVSIQKYIGLCILQ